MINKAQILFILSIPFSTAFVLILIPLMFLGVCAKIAWDYSWDMVIDI